jgi:hypothetical protein
MALRGTPAPLRGIRWPFSFCAIYSGLPVKGVTIRETEKRPVTATSSRSREDSNGELIRC